MCANLLSYIQPFAIIKKYAMTIPIFNKEAKIPSQKRKKKKDQKKIFSIFLTFL